MVSDSCVKMMKEGTVLMTRQHPTNVGMKRLSIVEEQPGQ